MLNNRTKTDRGFQADMSARTTTTYAESVKAVLVAEYGRLKHGEKLLARDSGCTPRAAKNWLTGANAPNGDALINLMRRCVALRNEINRLVEEYECAPSENECSAISGSVLSHDGRLTR